jgi:hypothetical protein
MRVINFDHTRDTLSQQKPIVIYVFSDTHIGHVGADLKKLQHHIQLCKKENAYWIHLGDWCESIGPWDRRFDMTQHRDPIEHQYNYAEKLFRPIMDNGIAILAANHDDTIRRHVGDKVSSLAARLNVPYLGISGFVGVRAWSRKHDIPKRKSASYVFTMFMHHGHGMGRLLGAKSINLQRMSHKFQANLYLIGHIHTHIKHIDEYMGINRASTRAGRLYLWRRNRAYASAPGYYSGFIDELNEYDEPVTTYVERQGYYPQPTGCLRIEIYPKQQSKATRRPEGGRDSVAKILHFNIQLII